MKINMIAAMDPHRVIGYQNKLPRNYPEDLKYFKKITDGNVIVMGYNTYVSIGRQLPNRRNIIMSKESIDGVENYQDINQLLEKLESDGVEEIFVIGGVSVYMQFLPLTDVLYITQIKKEYQGDTYFPEYEDMFHEVSRQESEEMDFVIYELK